MQFAAMACETVFTKGHRLSVNRQAYLNNVLVAKTNDHVRPCNLKPQHRDNACVASTG